MYVKMNGDNVTGCRISERLNKNTTGTNKQLKQGYRIQGQYTKVNCFPIHQKQTIGM